MKPRAEIIAGVPADAMPLLWVILMIAVAFLWAAYLDYVHAVGGSGQNKRATRSLWFVIAFGLTTAGAAMFLQMWAQS